MTSNINISQDQNFKKIQNLKWLPWIGKDYFAQDKRLLIIAESQYAQGETKEQYEKDLALVNSANFTRNAVQQTQIENYYKHLALDNFLKAMFGNATINKEKLWQNLAFYNFVQRTMDYSNFNGNKTEQPTNTDFDEGWKVFAEIIKILKPTDCVFIGVTGATSFERMMDSLNIQRTERIYHNKINSAKPATSSVTIDGLKTNISFIKHSSAYFSPESWHPFLKENHSEIIADLTSKIF
ncbi:hypothetical protein [Kaistella jeonii]|uniref:Uracil-DNA glycosylase n=1 Tax=Kaistella jeonii TaxID=266749 RepID=A0A0C1D6R0_9FLAO|nr:hypothetical protein [Kaistella jeonii]KIA89575.1 hypothetical protein OA86_02765 [Kaistella jeonii]SFB90710.1 hypothetical protein SAMN05421876_103347 [Kaistella jeonii]VEI95780.1 Uncharacterised protein [Kaistella jeonii]